MDADYGAWVGQFHAIPEKRLQQEEKGSDLPAQIHHERQGELSNYNTLSEESPLAEPVP